MRKIVCLDLDGTIADFSQGWQGHDHIGDPFPGAVEFTKKLAEYVDIVIFTTRCCEELNGGANIELIKRGIKDWLDKHGFVYTDIWTGRGKKIASGYIDDRAVTCCPFTDESAYESAFEQVMGLIDHGENYAKSKQPTAADAKSGTKG